MSTTAMKLLALALMVIDHVGEFIPGMPIWLRYMGRLSAPLFFFCMVWGIYYTHDKKIYLLRLYICSILMSVLDYLVPKICGSHEIISNNIFSTLFVAGVIISAIEYAHTNPSEKRKTVLVVLGWQAGALGISLLGDQFLNSAEMILTTMVGIMTTVEGGPIMVLAIIILYYCKNSRRRIILGYGTYCLMYICLIVTDFVPRVFSRLDFYVNNHIFDGFIEMARIMPFGLLGIDTIFYTRSWYKAIFINHYQWMMICALPIMLLYNGKRGKGLKWFFYVFYPVHIVILYCIGIFM